VAATGEGGTTARQLPTQRGQGRPYEVTDTQVWDVPDPVSGRVYQVFVALPPSYATEPTRRYPVLYATDADYAFPVLRQIGRRLNVEGPALEEFIIIGLSYAVGEDGMTSRRRDYTPTPKGPSSAPADAVHGGGAAYIAYLQQQVLPFVADRFRTDESRRMFLGHSYGSLLGTQMLFEAPGLFQGYILGSPSYWYDSKVMQRREAAYHQEHDELPARVYMYVGARETPPYVRDADLVGDAAQMAASLGSRDYASLQLTLEVLPDEDHLSVAPRGFTRGLRYLLSLPGKG